MKILQGRDGSISVRLKAECGDPVRGNLTYETVEMMDPMTGNPFMATVERGKYPEGIKITGEMFAEILRERDELLAALKACAEAWAKYLPEDCGEKASLPWPKAMARARALITKIEGNR